MENIEHEEADPFRTGIGILSMGLGVAAGALVGTRLSALVSKKEDKGELLFASFLINKSVAECESFYASTKSMFGGRNVRFEPALKGTFASLEGTSGREELRRFKQLIETGEIPTTEGQSAGPRSALGKLLGSMEQ